MWFMFGIVTVVTFIGYYSYQNYISNWTGEYSTFKGNDYSYKLIKRNRRYFNDLKIGVGGVDTFTFRLKEEKWYDRVFKKIGISIEQEVGESEFDKRIYIVSDDPVFLSYLNKNKEIKTELLQLFQTLHHRDLQSIKEIRCTKNRLWVHYNTSCAFEEKDVGVIAIHVIPLLVRIKMDLESLKHKLSLTKERDSFVVRASILVAISSCLFASGAILFFRMNWGRTPFLLNAGDPVTHSLMISFSVIFCLLILTLLLLGRNSRTHLVFIEIILIGNIGLFANSYAMLREINIKYDTSNIQYFVEPVIKKYTKRNKNGTSYHVTIKDWDSLTEVKPIEISSSFYNSIDTGTLIEFSLKDGYLGYKWVAEMNIKI